VRTVFLVGPTAAGKTAVALALAPALAAEIVSADSMQVYRGLDIGTAKPTAAEQRAVPHHLLDVAEPDATFDAKQFTELARRAIAGIKARGRTALVVGGSGLYVRALRRGLFAGPGRNPELRTRLEKLSVADLFAELQRVDPAAAATIDRHNPRRLVRALEVFHTTGRSIRELQREWPPGPGRDPSTPLRSARDDNDVVRSLERSSRAKPALSLTESLSGVEGSNGLRDLDPLAGAPVVGLTRPRDDLYARIEARVEAQLAAGWLAEVRAVPAGATALQAAGYRELAAHLRGELPLPEAVARIKARTRQLARRQLTWFRREPGLVWIELAREETATVTAERIREAIGTLEDV